MNLDQDITTMLRARAEGVAAAPMIPHGTLRRVRVRKTVMIGGVAALIAALVFGGFAATRSLSNDAVPIPPANETENKGPGAVTYSFPDVEVSLRAPEPWAEYSGSDEPTIQSNGAWEENPALVFDQNFEERLELDADPASVGTGCQPGVAPADAEALAREIRSDADLETTAPVTVSVGGVDALRMDGCHGRFGSGSLLEVGPRISAGADGVGTARSFQGGRAGRGEPDAPLPARHPMARRIMVA